MKKLLYEININHRGSVLIFILLLLHTTAFSQLKADFSASPTSGCAPLVVQFKDSSTGNPDSWTWDLGDGNPVNKQNPGIAYFNPGTYTIKLTIKNAATGETDSITKTAFITVAAKPHVEFSASPASGCLPLDVNFTDKSAPMSGNIQSWFWDFGDGIYDTIQNPSHTYNLADSFNVTLIVTNSFGCTEALQKTSYVAVADSVHANFSYTYTSICSAPSTFQFTNLSQNKTGLTYQWSFGDGETSNRENPSHTYSSLGDYDINLIARNPGGCTDTIIKSISIGTQVADFILPPTGCISEPVFLQDTSSPVPLDGRWIFGDGTSATGLSTSHVYKTAGAYKVTYIANFGGCTDSVQKTINIVNKPVASFNSPSVRTACSAPLTVQFTNASAGATDYLWDFGDSTTSTDINPVHTYTKTGAFTVRLIAFNGAGGCGDTILQTQFVKISPPDIKDFFNAPYKACILAPVTFKADIDTSESIQSYLWDFGDGTTSTSATPVHAYNSAGTYTIKLIVTSSNGCADTLLMPSGATISDKPVANFKAAPLDACASNPVQFTDLSTGNVTAWKWLFEDGGESAIENPLHQFRDTGRFTITLFASNGGCTDTFSIPNYIHINAPVAAFLSTPDCSNELFHSFSDTSIAAQTWNWDFGDGGTSIVQDPTHTYATPGVYFVTLVVTNGGCRDTATHVVYALNERPQFIITPLHSNFCRSDSIRFTATNFNAAYISNFLWNFGDGEVSSGAANNPTVHQYQQAGNYNPLLVTTDLNGCLDTAYNSATFEIYGPTASFQNPAGTCTDSSIIFTDSSITDGIHPLKKWIWNYGDGTIDTLTVPPPEFSHAYTATGSYNVKLVVFDSNGCSDTLLKTDAVTITRPFADFGVLDPLRCTSSAVTFTNSSGGSSLKYLWDFGDGDSSILRSPTHLYSSEGIYSVGLKITDRFGCTDTANKTNLITISNPKASFTISDSLATCPPLLVQTQNTSLDYTASFWDFGDGNTSDQISPLHSYTNGGKYTLMLMAHGFGECYDTASKIIDVKGPGGTFKYSPLNGCYPQQVSFQATTQNTSLYIWDFGDGSVETLSSNTASHQYDTPGVYIPKVILEDTAGCKVPLQLTDSIKVSGAFPRFGLNAQTGCDSSLVIFIDSSITTNFDRVNVRTWDFGDGTSSSDINPSHYYKTPGTYTTSLFVQTDSGCTGKFILPVAVNINKSPVIAANFLDSVCVNTPINFIATNSVNITDPLLWFWDFGNNDTSNIQDPEYTYTTAGTFNVNTIAKVTTTGCADTVQKNVTILPPPIVDAGRDSTLCLFQSLLLQPSGASSYEWQTSPTLSCSKCYTPLALPDATTTYYVTGMDAFGCKAEDSITVSVIQPTHLTVPVTSDTLCIGTSVQLNVTGAEQYNWQPATGLSSTTIGNPVASPVTTTSYTVIGSDSRKCFADTAQISILVAPLPTFNIVDSAVTLNVGSAYTIKTENSPNVTGWAWLPPYGLSCANCGAPVASPKADVTYTAQAITAFGCVAADNIAFKVICNNTNVFIPNTFSPNNDSKNDYFYPQGTGLFTIKSLRIFNRWGVLIFAKTNLGANIASNGWDGKYNGEDQQPDVYVYIMDVLCENGSVLSYKGNVTLIR